MPNPLFEREWRGRFRRFNSFAQIALLAIGVAAPLWWTSQFFAPNAASIEQIRATGLRFLAFYRIGGGALIFLLALLLGAVSVASEKTAGTFEQILLCPLRASEIMRGKMASGAAFLLLLQMAIWPFVLALGAAFYLPLLAIAGVIFAHFLAALLGLTLGILGALRRETVQNAFAGAFGFLLQLFFLSLASVIVIRIGALIIYVFVAIALIFLRHSELNGIFGWIQFLPNFWTEFGAWAQIAETRTILPFFAGVCGFGLGMETSIPVVLGVLASCTAGFRLAIWQLRYPDREFLAMRDLSQMNNAGLTLNERSARRWKVWIRVWREELSPRELELFEIVSQSAPPKNFAFQNRDPNAKSDKNQRGNGRLRLFSGRRFQNLNPVFALDLARCLSLRSPNPKAQLPLLLFAALGGSLAFAVGLFTLVSLLQSVFTQSRGDVNSLNGTFRALEIGLCYGALVSGTLFGALGFVVERRSQMLHELRLTLLSARAMLGGKWSARFAIFFVAAIPAWSLLAFWDSNRAEVAFLPVWSAQIALTCALGAFAVSLCLSVSFLAKNEIMAMLWCLAAILGLGIFWHFSPTLFSPIFALQTLENSWICAAFYGLWATLLAAQLFWRLRRLGFG